MADASKVNITPEAAERLGAPIREAERRADDYKRVCELEYTVTKTRDALRVITHALEDMAERHSTPDKRELSDDEVSELYGVITLLDYMAGECDRAYWEGAQE